MCASSQYVNHVARVRNVTGILWLQHVVHVLQHVVHVMLFSMTNFITSWDKAVWLSTEHDVIFIETSACIFRQSSARICRSQRSRGLRRWSAAARLLGLWVRILQGHGYLSLSLSLVSVVCCRVELSTSGWSLVQRSYTECGVCHSDREVLIMRRLWPPGGLSCHKKSGTNL